MCEALAQMTDLGLVNPDWRNSQATEVLDAKETIK